jgi:hypothetical protein
MDGRGRLGIRYGRKDACLWGKIWLVFIPERREDTKREVEQ